MVKQFFEVFPALKLEQKIQDLFEQVKVEKVSATKSRDYIRVTISSSYLIPKETVYKVETEIKKQLFAYQPVAVKLYERFRLSQQYTPEKLMDAYKESILLELKAYSPVEYHLFKGAEIAFRGTEGLTLTVEDTTPARSKASELSRIIEKIFNERCGFSVICRMEYKEKKNRSTQEEDLVIARQVAEIARRAALGAEGNSTAPADSAKPQPSAAQGGKEEKKEGFAPGQSKAPAGTGATGSFSAQTERRGFPRGEAAKGGRPDFKRPLKRSDHPDVI